MSGTPSSCLGTKQESSLNMGWGVGKQKQKKAPDDGPSSCDLRNHHRPMYSVQYFLTGIWGPQGWP